MPATDRRRPRRLPLPTAPPLEPARRVARTWRLPSAPSLGGLPDVGGGFSGFGQQLADMLGGLMGSGDALAEPPDLDEPTELDDPPDLDDPPELDDPAELDETDVDDG